MHRCKDASCTAFVSCNRCEVCGGTEGQHYAYTDSPGYDPRWWELETGGVVTVAGIDDDHEGCLYCESGEHMHHNPERGESC